MTNIVKYPIGEQDFESLRLGGYVYVDKTRYIERLIVTGTKYCFLSRPRRFGKSLFLSTLASFFEGKRHLFDDLHIADMEWNWDEYPVLVLDLNTEKYGGAEQLRMLLNAKFSKWEHKYGVTAVDESLSERFGNIIAAAHRLTGRQVVILVDEYDKPMVANLNNPQEFENYRSELSAVYANFKSSAAHIRMVFMTGVSRFSKLSVFSGLNNLDDITYTDDYADICGIADAELERYFKPGLEALAEKLDCSKAEAVALLKQYYDGYRFAARGSDMYNPWSVLSAMRYSQVKNYWNHTGIPTVIGEALKRIDVDLEEYFNSECDERELLGLDISAPSPLALLYQTGYLTIKSYDPEYDLYQLGIPNLEVREGLYHSLLPYYVDLKNRQSDSLVRTLNLCLRNGQPDRFMQELQAYFAGISYKLKIANENNFHNAFNILLNLIGFKSEVEKTTSDGRIDILIGTDRFVYIIEFKFDGSAKKALEQIERKQYNLQFSTDSRQVFKIGVNFSSETRRIDDWVIT